MSKKFTSFLVLAAALLLSAPSQAQVVKKASNANAKTFKTGKLDKQALQKAKDAQLKANEAQVEAISFKAAAASQQSAQSIEEAKALKAADNTVGKPFATWNWAAHATPQFVSNSGLFQNDNLPKGTHRFSNAPKNFKVRAAVPKKGANKVQGDPNAIITEVPATAEVKYYAISGSYHKATTSGNTTTYSVAEQSGNTAIAFDGDDVYIKNPITGYSSGTWVKGTKAGNTITVPLGQFLSYFASDGYGLYITLANVTSSFSGTNLTDETEVTYTIDGNTISLNGTNETKTLTVAWSDDDTVYKYGAPGGNYNTVYTLDEDYTPPTAQTELVELPSGVTPEDWYAEGINQYPSGSSTPTAAKVAFDGNDVYVSGIFTSLPNAWIKGTLEGNKVTFVTGQLLGQLTDGSSGTTYNVYAVGYDGSGILDKFTMTYDATEKKLTLDEGNEILANTSVENLGYFQWIKTLVISAEAPAPAQIDALPYSNDFSTSDLKKHFTTIDANGDGNTWTWANEEYYINYADANNDWLVSPAIKLVAGKKYHFAFDSKTRSSNYPETFEVKAAKEATAEALAAGTTVIAQQQVTSATYSTIETEEFTVSETGYYYIGIHNTSLDQWTQYVDNFLIEAAPITAPYTGDFSQEGTMDDYSSIDNNGDGKTWAWSATYGAYYSYNTASAADDYLILPIKLEASKNYNVTVTASTASPNYKEKFEVKVGKAGTVDALTKTVISKQEFASTVDTDFEGSFTSEEEGVYYVAIHVTSDANMWRLNIKKLVIGDGAEGDAPAAVDGLTVTPLDDVLGATVAFNAPTKSIDGSVLAEGDITKIEILRDGNVIHTIDNPTPGSAYTCNDIASDLTIGNHKYQVVPYGASGAGEKSEEITVFLSATLTVPYTFDLASDIISTFSVIDNNADGNTWKWSASYGTYYGYSYTNAADDYLISLPFRLEAGKNYIITVGAKGSKSYPEKLEVLVGQEATVAGLTQTVIPVTSVATGDVFADFEGEFTVSADGIYYIAVHAISDADQFNLCVNKLSIEKVAEPTAPAATELTATPGAEGALNVDLSFTAPANAVDGSALSGTEDVKIYRDDALVNTLTGVAPGSAQTWTDTNVEDGKTYVYYVVAANESGDGQKSNKVSVYVGEDALADVENVVATAAADKITFTWDEVTGANGGYVNTANVEYKVYSLEVVSTIFGDYLDKGEVLATVTGATTATIDYDTMGEQKYVYFGVSAENASGETDPTTNYVELFVGAPYELPIEEGFADKTLHYSWFSNGGLGIDENASDDDGVALKLYNDGTSANVYFYLPRVNLNPAAKPTLIFDVKAGVGVSQVSAIGAKEGEELGTLTTASLTDAYTTIKVPLDDIKGGAFSSVGISANIPTASVSQYEDYLIIDNITLSTSMSTTSLLNSLLQRLYRQATRLL